MSSNPELGGSPETGKKVETLAEQVERLPTSPERSSERLQNAEKSAEQARFEALESAISVEAGGSERKKASDPAPVKHRGPISKKQKEVSFKRQMKEVQAELPAPSRAFSKLIHNKLVEKTSDTLGATIARPNAILAGAVAAFVLTLGVYVIAKTIGYRLSGFETIAAFIIGWVAGIIYDYLRVIVTGKK